MGKLAQKKSYSPNMSAADAEELEKATAAELEKVNKSFDEQEAFALSHAQEDVLLALSSIYMDDALLKPVELGTTGGADGAKDVEDEDGFDDNLPESSAAAEAARQKKAKEWISRVDQIKGTYLNASVELQQRLRQAHRDSADTLEKEALQSIASGEEKQVDNLSLPEDTYCGVATHMMKVANIDIAPFHLCPEMTITQVITEAFDNQISDQSQEEGSNRVYGKHRSSKGQQDADAARAKAEYVLQPFPKQ